MLQKNSIFFLKNTKALFRRQIINESNLREIENNLLEVLIDLKILDPKFIVDKKTVYSKYFLMK